MKKWYLAATLSVAVAGSSLLSAAQAQGPGGGGGGGGMSRSPKGRLTGLIRSIGELEKGPKKLTKAQAKTIVATVNAWKAKPKMTDDEAKGVYGKINGALTTPQKNELDKMAAKNRRTGSSDRGPGGGAGGPGGGGFGGGAGGGGGQAPSPADMAKFRAAREKMSGFFKTYNPFYSPANYKELKDKDIPDRMRESFTRRYKSRMDVINKLAAKAK